MSNPVTFDLLATICTSVQGHEKKFTINKLRKALVPLRQLVVYNAFGRNHVDKKKHKKTFPSDKTHVLCFSSYLYSLLLFTVFLFIN